jgi:hypothetical protein
MSVISVTVGRWCRAFKLPSRLAIELTVMHASFTWDGDE